jgi:hypothetical protein
VDEEAVAEVGRMGRDHLHGVALGRECGARAARLGGW